MTARRCTELTAGCYRCDLNRDEIEHAIDEARAEAQDAWIAYRNRRALTLGLTPARAASQMRRREFIAGYLAYAGIEETR